MISQSSLVAMLLSTYACAAATRKHLLFLSIDDMAPIYGETYGPSWIYTPFIDELSRRGVVFDRAFCQAATCGVSRSSFLTGRRVDTTGVYSNGECFYKTGGNWTSLPHYLKSVGGYITRGSGKIFHPGVCEGLAVGEDAAAWTQPYYHSPCPQHGSFPCEDTGDRPYGWFSNQTATEMDTADGLIATTTINEILQAGKELQRERELGLEATPRAFFCGMHKPHLPLVSQTRFFDQYPPGVVPKPPNPLPPTDLPSIAWNPSGEIRSYDDVRDQTMDYGPNTTFPANLTATLRRAYAAALSGTDEQVGRLVGALRAAGMENDTLIVMATDHGWSRGNNNEWAKHTIFHAAVHSTLLIVDPSLPPSRRGVRTSALAELIDLYPTVVDLLGLPVPDLCPHNSTDIRACVEGSSLRPVLENSDYDSPPLQGTAVLGEDLHGRRAVGASSPGSGLVPGPSTGLMWKNSTFSQWPKDDDMGYSIRTDRWRYTRWVGFDSHARQGKWDELKGEELYDQQEDPFEITNRAGDPAVAAKKAELFEQLKLGWRAALPKQAGAAHGGDRTQV